MKTVTTVTAAEFASKKKIALDTAPVRKLVNTGDIKIKDSELFINEKRIEFSRDGISQFAETIGIPSKFIKKYSGIFGDEGTNKLINHISSGLGSNNKQIMLIASPVTGTVIDVKPKNHKYISAISFMKLVEDTMNDHKGLSISNFYVDDRGQLRIDALNQNKEFNFGRNEDFFAGLNFAQSPKEGTNLSQYMFRQICSNGNFGKSDVKVNFGFDDDIMKSIYKNINKVAENDFIPIGFGARIKRASNVRSSYSELKQAMKEMPDSPMIVEKFIPLSSIMADLHGRKIHVESLNTQQEKNCRLNCSVWDVVNALTDFASHDYGHNISPMQSQSIQQTASKMFFKTDFDTENLIG